MSRANLQLPCSSGAHTTFTAEQSVGLQPVVNMRQAVTFSAAIASKFSDFADSITDAALD
jgi:hypothetical protein